MMKQFQQCYLSMAQMFAAMQQEHAALVSEQVRQIQEMADELRELRAETRQNGAASAHGPTLPVSVPAPAEGHSAAPSTPQPRVPSLKVPPGKEGKALSDAHTWFMERLAGKAQPPAGT
jgi:hypothetical protein